MPYNLPENITTVYLAAVNNPTTESFLVPKLRNEFSDELTRRGDIKWVEESEAQGKIVINILSFRSGAKLESAAEKTVRSEMVLRLEARLYSSRTGALLSRTGPIVARESFGSQGGSAQGAVQDRLIQLAAELAVQRLNQAF
ncbi:MAG: LPS assembly lipoprotein LptE [Thermodesulfobacteriota bacterium]